VILKRYNYLRHSISINICYSMICLILIYLTTVSRVLYTVGHKNVLYYFCPHLCQLSIDFQISFLGTLCIQFAIM